VHFELLNHHVFWFLRAIQLIITNIILSLAGCNVDTTSIIKILQKKNCHSKLKRSNDRKVEDPQVDDRNSLL
jgi:hypothetical protein